MTTPEDAAIAEAAKAEAAKALAEAAAAAARSATAAADAATAAAQSAAAAAAAASAVTPPAPPAVDPGAHGLTQFTKPDDLAALFTENFKQAMDSHRFFGMLRTQVAWQPATIALTAIAFFWDKMAINRLPIVIAGYVLVTIPGPYLPVIIIAAILTLIFVANLALARQQRICTRIAQRAESELAKARAGVATPALSYFRLQKLASAQANLIFPIDASTKSLFGFFLVLLSFVLLFAEYRKDTPTALPNPPPAAAPAPAGGGATGARPPG